MMANNIHCSQCYATTTSRVEILSHQNSFVGGRHRLMFQLCRFVADREKGDVHHVRSAKLIGWRQPSPANHSMILLCHALFPTGLNTLHVIKRTVEELRKYIYENLCIRRS